jgi:VWFA-related protein
VVRFDFHSLTIPRSSGSAEKALPNKSLEFNEEARLQMKTRNKLAVGLRILAWIGALLLGLLTVSAGQEKRTGRQQSQDSADKDFTVRIGVEEVRLDVVVLDKKGHQVTNLTANDFEIYQDGKPMEIHSCSYIANESSTPKQPAVDPKAPKTPPLISTQPLSREAVQRVIVFVVDDLSMSFESMQYTRTALKKFVEKEMQPGDLISILRTTHGSSAHQMFLSDKKQLLTVIDTVRWGKNVGLDLDPRDLYMIFDGQLSTIRYCIRALKDMPGRKALIVMTSMSTFPSDWTTGGVQDSKAVQYDQLYYSQYSNMANDALQAGVVIHTMEMRGLEAPFPDTPTDAMLGLPSGAGNQSGGRGIQNGSIGSPDQLNSFGRGTTYGQMGGRSTPSSILQRNIEMRDPLSERTGGLFLSDRNFAGLEEINDALKGYYLLSYIPPPGTFEVGRQNIYHRTKVVVKGSGFEVHTRDGFYGMPALPANIAEITDPAFKMRDAIYSPFRYSDLTVSLAAGYLEDAKTGYLVRSWLHLNPNELNMIQTTNNGQAVRSIELETVSMTNDITGAIHDSSLIRYKFNIPENNLAYIREHGIRFSLALPVKKPGPYYVRVAVRDEVSGKIGSAYQFVEIPNLSKGKLALSDLFIVNHKEDIAWIMSGAPKQESQFRPIPNINQDNGKSPALRIYHPGESFDYLAVVYNAKRDLGKTFDLESQYILYKNGRVILKGEPRTLDLKNTQSLNEIPIMGRMTLDKALQEGDYVLQLSVWNKRDESKKNLIAQTLDFTIEKSP